MKLYIAEKPGLGRAIAEVLPKPHIKEDGCIRVGNGDYVSWCIGHLLEQAEPHVYNPAFKQWREEHLPIVPEQWKLQPRSKTKKQLAVLRRLVKQADTLVHAGDPDREGQLLVDQVIEHFGVKGKKRDSVQRCLISDLNPDAVKRSLSQLRDNKEFIPLSTSALARSRADWLYGINMTRAYTLQGRKVGYEGLLSVGRVQTPVLGLVVKRDLEIENFVSKAYFEVLAHVETTQQQRFTALWQPSEACHSYMDDQDRVLSKALASNVVERITNKPAEVTKLDEKQRTQAPPLPYSLSALQIDAARQHGFSAQQVLDICQALYERHKLITYPRSDSRYLPQMHYAQRNEVLQTIENNCPPLTKFVAQADRDLKTRAWNDSKVNAHHAIIPTERKLSRETLNKQELQVYTLVARQYLCQFYPPHLYSDTRVELVIGGGKFVAVARVTKTAGWKVLFAKNAKQKITDQSSREKTAHSEIEDEQEKAMSLPALKKGDCLHCSKGELLEKQTQPPHHFTDATLLSAMTGIARFVEDAEIRKILKDTDGLGTEATRASILELLFKRHFLTRKGKQIHSTATGRGLILSLPESAITPDMTAQWESVLEQISNRQASYQVFMQPLIQTLHGLIAHSKTTLPCHLKGLKATKSRHKKRRRKSGKGA